MTLPTSFARDGFQAPAVLRGVKKRRLLVGCDGPPDSGKSEFALSAPGPGLAICLDRGLDPLFDNRQPPASRQSDWAFQVITAPLQTQTKQETFQEYWALFRDTVKRAAANPNARTLLLDGDSDSWELQRLAAFGTLSQIPSIRYTEVNAARRAFYARLWDSGKIIIATNKIRKVYKNKMLPDGTVAKDPNSGKDIREWDGKTYERQGFDDQEYLWQIQLTHMYSETKQQWGIRIKKCKVDPSLVGMELWGNDCNFQSLVQVAYPNVPLSEWGY